MAQLKVYLKSRYILKTKDGEKELIELEPGVEYKILGTEVEKEDNGAIYNITQILGLADGDGIEIELKT